MDDYKTSRDPDVFEKLFDLNRASFLRMIQTRLGSASRHLDAQDVLQEVFLNIHRYPHRFQAHRHDAFRHWSHRIIQNTLFKFLRRVARHARFQSLGDDLPLPEDPNSPSPERVVSESERARTVNNAYLLLLGLYLRHFQGLSSKERRALSLVEIDGATYRQAAVDLGIKLENLRMLVFRSRRKIFQRTICSLGELDVRLTNSESAAESP